MRALPQVTDPFRLSKHLVEVHEISDAVVDLMDSDELRRMHGVLHRHVEWFVHHIHVPEEDLEHSQAVLDQNPNISGRFEGV